jgi:hypothetical protein
MSPGTCAARIGCSDHDCVFRVPAGRVGTNGGCRCVPTGRWLDRDEALKLAAQCMGLAAELDASGSGVTLGQRIPRMLAPIIGRVLNGAYNELFDVDPESMRALRAEVLRVRDEARACMGATGGGAR